jgi:hypothetical protein
VRNFVELERFREFFGMAFGHGRVPRR